MKMLKLSRTELIKDDLTTKQQKERFAQFEHCQEAKHMLLGGTTYQYSLWAVRDHGTIRIFRTPYDFTGRWVKAKIRPWNR